jgi:hypothetical protein
MSYPAILDAISARGDVLLTTLATLQAGYYATHSRYAQGLWTHSTCPTAGSPVTPDALTDRPYYQSESWASFNAASILPATMHTRLRLDQYIGPNGAGYVLTQQTIVAGDKWEQSINVGPDAIFDVGWHVVDTTPP